MNNHPEVRKDDRDTTVSPQPTDSGHPSQHPDEKEHSHTGRVDQKEGRMDNGELGAGLKKEDAPSQD